MGSSVQGQTGLVRFWPIARKLVLGTGITLGAGIILYSIADMILIADGFGQSPGYLNTPTYLPITLFGLFIFFLLGTSVIRVSLTYSRGKLQGGRLMGTIFLGSLYLIVLGVALLSFANNLVGSTSTGIGATIANNGILLIASGVLMIISGAFLRKSSQASRIAGGVLSIVAGALLAILINGQSSSSSISFSSLVSSSNLPFIFEAGLLQPVIGVTGSSTLSTPGFFLASYWAEIPAVILGAVGLLAWSVLYNRKEARYAVAIGVAAFLVYGIGLMVNGFQTSATIFNAVGSISSSNLTGYASRVLSESQLLAWSLLIAGIGGVLALVASGMGIALAVLGVRPMIVQEQKAVVPVSATGGVFCRKCGAQARLGDTFCPSCGAGLT